MQLRRPAELSTPRYLPFTSPLPTFRAGARTVTAMRFAVVAHRLSDTNLHLAAIGGGEVLSPREALLGLGHGDVALARLDVLESVDGVEPGIPELERLAAGGVTVLNPPSTLLACHDKLLTARALRRAGLPHPRTIAFGGGCPPLEFPCVLKPRFGSWGRKVELCADEEQLRHSSRRERPWLVQELVPPLGYDLRLVVAGGRVVGAGRRTAAPGEWRTNVALARPSRPSSRRFAPARSQSRRPMPSVPRSSASTCCRWGAAAGRSSS